MQLFWNSRTDFEILTPTSKTEWHLTPAENQVVVVHDSLVHAPMPHCLLEASLLGQVMLGEGSLVCAQNRLATGISVIPKHSDFSGYSVEGLCVVLSVCLVQAQSVQDSRCILSIYFMFLFMFVHCTLCFFRSPIYKGITFQREVEMTCITSVATLPMGFVPLTTCSGPSNHHIPETPLEACDKLRCTLATCCNCWASTYESV